MKKFHTAYRILTNASANKKLDTLLKDPNQMKKFNPKHIECLLNPDKCAPVIRTEDCICQDKPCTVACEFDALTIQKGNAEISKDNCVGCGECIKMCREGILHIKKDLLAVMEELNNPEKSVYAIIAPAFNGQFSHAKTSGELRYALKQAGFTGMIEAALMADILTLKEALEFHNSVHSENDFLLTSCCCPIWIALIKHHFSGALSHIPPSVSPMIGSGRLIKKLIPHATTVFIGPCAAKKAEAQEKDIADAVDYVLTFDEIKDLFDMLKINPDNLKSDERYHSSKAGRIYAKAGGVSQAVSEALDSIYPENIIKIKPVSADGVQNCKKLIESFFKGDIDANFLEGMGCVGGCVGGPKKTKPAEKGKENVEKYGNQAEFKTPAENPYVISILNKLGLNSIESLLQNDTIFIRNFK